MLGEGATFGTLRGKCQNKEIFLVRSFPHLNKDKNHYYYNIFLEKCSDQLVKK